MATRKTKAARKSTARKPARKPTARKRPIRDAQPLPKKAAKKPAGKPKAGRNGKAKAAKCAVCGAEVKPSKCFCSLDCYIEHRKTNG